MASHSITISLGSGEKGEKWKSIIMAAAKRSRMSAGQFIRNCIRIQVAKQEQPETDAPGKEQTEAAQ